MSGRIARTRVLLSAHRGGCGRSPDVENTLAAFADAVKTSVEYIEFDVQRTSDGVFLLNHDDRVCTPYGHRFIKDMTAVEVERWLGPRVRYEQVLSLLAESRRKAHLDFKFISPQHLYADPASTWEVEAVQIARRYLSDAEYIVTTVEDLTVRAVRDWADAEGLEVVVGLSIGRHRLTGMHWWQKARWRIEEAFPERRIRRSRANLLVAQRHLARWRLIAWAHRNNLPVLVWTVDSDRELRRLLSDRRVWMVTSNYPERGVALREGSRAAA